MMFQGMGGMMYGWGGGWMILGVIFWVLIATGIIFLVIWISDRNESSNLTLTESEDTAMEVLKKRYAKGEITKEEFEQIRRDLL